MLSPALGQTGELAYQITARLTLPQGRGTGTREEAGAARWLAELLHSWGLKVQQEEFLAIADMNWFPMSAAGLCLLSYLLFPWPGWSSWVAGALALWPPLLLWWALTRADSPLRALLPRVESRSIITCLPPAGQPAARVAVLAHLDTNRCRWHWRAGKERTVLWGSWLSLSLYGVMGAALWISLLTGDRRPYLAALPGASYALISLILLALELRQPYSPGAVDNASSVGVACELARRAVESPLRELEIWFCFTGAEETDHRGVKKLIRRYPQLKEAWFLVLEGVGAGELVWLSREGVVPYRPHPQLAKLAHRVAERCPGLGVRSEELLVVDETQTLRRAGLAAITIAGVDPATHSLPGWHTTQDDLRLVSREALARAVKFTWELLGELSRLASSESLGYAESKSGAEGGECGTGS